MNNKDIHLDLLRKLELNPELTQRELSREMGVSLGKVNYCMKKLFSKGLIKLNNFSSNPNKVRYVYILTPRGLEEKAKLTIKFLKIKMEEYELLKDEITSLQKDTDKIKSEQK
ncbi:MarR family EPS-associated transcriptional regulator [Candidatus Thioglobus sp.]|nr:MarR family EPS-associated transcriptional regulator [Candidatus Thioglobus sp.]